MISIAIQQTIRKLNPNEYFINTKPGHSPLITQPNNLPKLSFEGSSEKRSLNFQKGFGRLWNNTAIMQ